MSLILKLRLSSIESLTASASQFSALVILTTAKPSQSCDGIEGLLARWVSIVSSIAAALTTVPTLAPLASVMMAPGKMACAACSVSVPGIELPSVV